jgi:hypothetical protein
MTAEAVLARIAARRAAEMEAALCAPARLLRIAHNRVYGKSRLDGFFQKPHNEKLLGRRRPYQCRLAIQ